MAIPPGGGSVPRKRTPTAVKPGAKTSGAKKTTQGKAERARDWATPPPPHVPKRRGDREQPGVPQPKITLPRGRPVTGFISRDGSLVPTYANPATRQHVPKRNIRAGANRAARRATPM